MAGESWSTSSSVTRPSSSPVRTGRRPWSLTTAWTRSGQLRAPVDELPTGTPEHAAALAQYREDLTGLRNRPGGFWIAGPEPRAAEHALTGTVPLESLASVTLLSDGGTRLVDRFNFADWPGVLDALGPSGPDELIRRVRATENGDPDGQRWPHGKARDDATVLHWVLSSWLHGATVESNA